MFMRKSRRNEAWQGVVIGKKRGMVDGSSMVFFLKVQLSDGTAKRVRVRRKLWKSLQEGDGVVKRAGEEPVKM
ncbi:hypothetical protein KGQ20_18805 [Catenulispora sp. NF23]|uniref:DUF7489 domain-containing protein n=1 Tax=Catenulispora pinistramenti TaxID=2705254 RepID=A0ABS5KXB3_9ACTN|nr:hypothetical protein [Catenulispora pinistramenti]MBS2534824.1 hypothetical protein [Catenulispora pinistramenti]MBS2550707.1 hypothetical protein [Catenulispora pinistramenti]